MVSHAERTEETKEVLNEDQQRMERSNPSSSCSGDYWLCHLAAMRMNGDDGWG